jgi:nitrogen-specific signal transduction histidine kinase
MIDCESAPGNTIFTILLPIESSLMQQTPILN